jgi:hypothetical protein
MGDQDRRHFLKGLLGRLVQSAGVVVLASAAASRVRGEQATNENSPGDVRERADQLARDGRRPADAAGGEAQPVNFLNLSLGRPPGRPGAWVNGGWPNGGLGGWRNAGLGGFRNVGWPNGGWPNVGWVNGGWPNGGWRNVFF